MCLPFGTYLYITYEPGVAHPLLDLMTYSQGLCPRLRSNEVKLRLLPLTPSPTASLLSEGTCESFVLLKLKSEELFQRMTVVKVFIEGCLTR